VCFTREQQSPEKNCALAAYESENRRNPQGEFVDFYKTNLRFAGIEPQAVAGAPLSLY
jgi:hypothetical protein